VREMISGCCDCCTRVYQKPRVRWVKRRRWWNCRPRGAEHQTVEDLVGRRSRWPEFTVALLHAKTAGCRRRAAFGSAKRRRFRRCVEGRRGVQRRPNAFRRRILGPRTFYNLSKVRGNRLLVSTHEANKAERQSVLVARAELAKAIPRL